MKSQYLNGLIAEPVVELDEVEYTYVSRTGELYTGCSTIASVMDKAFLGPWYAKETAEEIKSKRQELIAYTKEKFDKVVDEAKKAAPNKADKAKNSGKIAHAFVENIITQVLQGQKPEKTILPKDKEAAVASKAFIEWLKVNKRIEWLACEEVVNSPTHRVAGMIDSLANINGISTLVDIKTSNQVSESYFVQLAGYALMLEEMGFPVRQWMIVRLPKDGKEVETLTITDLKDQEFYKEIFVHLREVHRFRIYLTNHKKNSRGVIQVDK